MISKKNRIYSFFAVLVFALLLLAATTPQAVRAVEPEQFSPQPYSGKLLYKSGYKYLYQYHINLKSVSHSKEINSTTGEKVSSRVSDDEVFATVELTTIRNLVGGISQMKMVVRAPRIIHTDESGSQSEQNNNDFTLQLARPVYFEQAPSGEIIRFMAHIDETTEVLNLKKGIVSSLQANFNVADKSSHTETGVTGNYQSNYSVSQDNGQLVVAKSRTLNDYNSLVDEDLAGSIKAESAGNIELTESTKIVLDTSTGTITSVSSNNHIISASQADRDFVPDEGMSIWSEILGNAKLEFTSKQKLASPENMILSGYRDTNLQAISFEDEFVEEHEILADVLTNIKTHPLTVKYFEDLVTTLKNSPSALNDLHHMLTTGQITEEMADPVISALGTVGTIETQNILVQTVLSNPQVPESFKESALMSLASLENPSPETISYLEMLSSDFLSPLNDRAILTLGAVAEKVAVKDAEKAKAIVAILQNSLSCANNDEQIILYLDALGNAGFESSSSLISPYLNHSSVLVRAAAVESLRKLPLEVSEIYLNDCIKNEQDESVRILAEGILFSKVGSEEFLSDAKGTTKGWSWSKWIGGGDVKAKLYAILQSKKVGENLSLLAKGELTGYAWSWSKSLLKVQATSDVIYKSGVLKRRFETGAYVLGNKLAGYTFYINCGRSMTGKLLRPKTLKFFDFKKSFYPYGVKVTVGIKGSGTVGANYTLAFNACNAWDNATASAQVTPYGYVSASGTAYVSLFIVKAGVTISADLLRTEIPAFVKGVIQTRSPYIKAQINVSLKLQSIKGKLELWYKLRWGKKHSWTIWKFSKPSEYRTLVNRWFY